MMDLSRDIWASFTALTRIPLWRIYEVPHKHFQHITDHWSMVGWLTGGVMALVLWLTGMIFPMPVAVILAFISRLLLTGALHEDGLMDLLDGLGGGYSRDRILEIMKDTQTGAYATIGFITYAILWVSLLGTLSMEVALVVVIISDPMAKFVASHLPMVLPYARSAEDSKMQVAYRRHPPFRKWLLSALFGLTPMLLSIKLGLSVLCMSIIVFLVLFWVLRKRINGYTGDCIGALFLLCEIGGYLGAQVCFYFYN